MLLPSISAVMPVRSETKKTVRRFGFAGGSGSVAYQFVHTGVTPAGSGGRSPRSIELSPGP